MVKTLTRICGLLLNQLRIMWDVFGSCLITYELPGRFLEIQTSDYVKDILLCSDPDTFCSPEMPYSSSEHLKSTHCYWGRPHTDKQKILYMRILWMVSLESMKRKWLQTATEVKVLFSHLHQRPGDNFNKPDLMFKLDEFPGWEITFDSKIIL